MEGSEQCREVRRRSRRASFPNSLERVTAQAESGNRDYANGKPVTSPKGAMYAMQVRSPTAAKPGFGVSPAKANTPAEFNRVGRDYLAAMRQKYGGDLALMWAGYNLGPGRLDAILARHGADWIKHVPKETRDYVTANLAALRGR